MWLIPSPFFYYTISHLNHYYEVPQFKYQAITAYGVLTLTNLVNTRNIQKIYLHSRPASNIYGTRGKSTKWKSVYPVQRFEYCAKLSVLEPQIGTLKQGKSLLDTIFLCKKIYFVMQEFTALKLRGRLHKLTNLSSLLSKHFCCSDSA